MSWRGLCSANLFRLPALDPWRRVRLDGGIISKVAKPDGSSPWRRVVACAAREPVNIYVHTRNVAADITAGRFVAIIGVALFHQFTPVSISAGSALAHIVAKEQAVSDFAFGETLGRLYYDLFPVSPSLIVVVVVLLSVMATIAVIAAFSGFVHDPIQTWMGIHRHRLSQLLDAIEESSKQSVGKGYRP